MIKKISVEFLMMILGICLLILLSNICWAAGVPRQPSRARVVGTQLILEKRLANGTLDSPKPYLIKGLTWQPATKAPAIGPNPVNPQKKTDYGFFFDWPYRNPSGDEVLNYWLIKQLNANYKKDIGLMQNMNINTVRVYTHFGDTPAIYNKILDEFYLKNIMVIMTAAIDKSDFEPYKYGTDKFYLDPDLGFGYYVPSGWMGDYGDLIYGEASNENPHTGPTCIKITYTAKKSQKQGWAGIYWQYPENNWGKDPKIGGLDLRDYNKLVFHARGEKGGELVVKFKVGGITGDTANVELRNVKLTSDWKEYTINLKGKNLGDIRGGFCIVFNGAAKTVYLDDIYFTYDPILGGQRKMARYEKTVEAYKNHPAILMWSLGNEWNLNKFYGYGSLAEAIQALNSASSNIKNNLDYHHPVSSCLGDVFTEPTCEPEDSCCDINNLPWVIPDIVQNSSSIDLWGINVYRGRSFGALFDQWLGVSVQPFYLSELGTDSYKTITSDHVTCYQVKNCVGQVDQNMQADLAIGLWDEIKPHLSTLYSSEQCLGGLVHEFNDELWRVGNYHVGLGGLNDNAHSYDDYGAGGFYLPGGHPDDVANEEYFGIVDANRNPKAIYNRLKSYYEQF